MPFNSLNFGVFFLIFYIIYLVLLKSHRLQNIWLLAASYLFYAFWDWRFLFVLVGITACSYLVGLSLGALGSAASEKPLLRRTLLGAGLLFNLGTLIFFKYSDFFSAGLLRIFDGLNLPLDTLLANIILPVGLSFYSLQACSYLLDVSARRIQPARNVLEFALFVAFFPQLLAGPIERAWRMLPQFHAPRKLAPDTVSAGIYLLFSGFLKKMVVADNLGLITTTIFDNYPTYTGVDLLLGTLAFTIQLYADFSAYSDIARGLARLLGFELVVNFRLPYFSASPAEFWSRWHISLSEWLRDYIFYPLRRALLRWKSWTGRLAGLLLPPLITMLVSGIWHGTGWNFLVWGLYHGILLILYQLLVKERPLQPADHSGVGQGAGLGLAWTWLRPRLVTAGRILVMFSLVCFGWLIFRVESPSQLAYFLTHLSLAPSSESAALWANLVLFSLPLVAVQVLQQARRNLLVLAQLPLGLRILLYAAALALIVVLGVRQASEFIYVQF
jgi:alginate O-acetyltransferase complex protein AlgI